MKKPKNIPTYYNFPGAPVFRDTTALPFKNGGNLNDSKHEAGEVYTWSGDADSYYRFNITRNQWEYLNNKTKSKTGKYIFQPVKNKKTIKQLENEAIVNPTAKEQLLTWASDPTNYEVSFLVADEGKVKGKRLSFEERKAKEKELLAKGLPVPMNYNFFNNVENMTSTELENKGRSMGPTAEGAKYLEMAAVQKQNEAANKYNSYVKNITTGRMHADEEQPWTYETVSPLPYSGLTEGPLITRQEKDARDFFNYLKENKDVAQQILGRELTEEELFNETGGYNNFAQSDLYTNYGNKDFINKIEDQKYQNFLAENQKAADEAGVVYNTLDFGRSLGSDFFGTVGNLLTEGKMPLYQQSLGLRSEDPKLREYYQQYMPSGLSEVDNIINFANPISSAVDAKLAYDQGNYGSAILSGLGALPLIGGLGKGLRGLKGISKLDDWNNINWNFGKYGTAEDVAGATNAIGGVQLADNAGAKLLNTGQDATGINKVLTDEQIKNIVVNEQVPNAKTLLSTEGEILPESASWHTIMEDFKTKLREVDLTKPLTDEDYIKAADAINPEISKVASLDEIKAAHQQALEYFKGAEDPEDIALYIRDALAEKLPSIGEAPTMVDGYPTYSAGFSVSRSLDPNARQFYGPKSVFDKAMEWGYDLNNLTAQQQNMLAAYTKGYDFPINIGQRFGFKDMGLRGDFYQKNANTLLEAILANKFPNDTSVIRSIKTNYPLTLLDKAKLLETKDIGLSETANTKYRRQLQKSDVIGDKGFLSTSLIPDLQWGKARLGERIMIPGGSKQSYGFPNASSASSSPFEGEIVLPSGLGREVVSVLPDNIADIVGYKFITKILNPYLAPLGVGAAAGTTGLAGNNFDQSNYNAYGNMGLTTGGKSNAYGGPLNDRNINGKLLQSTYASPLGNMFREGGPFGEDQGTFDYANSIYASQPGNYYRTGGQFPRPYSLPEDSFKQGGNNLHNSVYASSNAQYPAIYKLGGNINVVAGGEKHRVYIKESPTGVGEGVKGHVMVNHPTMDKGQWDTIDLTVKARAKTIEQGIAATKKWHKENPNVYRQGGSVLSMSNTPQLQGEGKDLTYPDNAYIYAGGGLIKRADGSYSQRGLWDNIRANIGSGKKPTKQMLQQEKKINKNYK